MAKKPAPEPAVPPSALPASGGAWLRLPDGRLVRDPGQTPDAPREAAVEPPVKEP